MSLAKFDDEELLAEARAEAGLVDFGAGHLDRLRMLVRTYEENPFHERGRARSRRQLVRLLVTRLRVIEAWRRHPEILSRPIREPWFLTGLPRSGTSALFNLLAADPSARALRNWEARIPEPLEGLAPGAPDPRRAALAASYERGRAEHPEFAAMHYTSVDTPEECVLLQGSSFSSVHTGDGSFELAVAHADPGHPNWISTAGHEHGTMGLRWVLADAHPEPRTRVVNQTELRR